MSKDRWTFIMTLRGDAMILVDLQVEVLHPDSRDMEGTLYYVTISPPVLPQE